MSTVDFASLGVSAPVLKAVQQLGYEVPSPIQAQSIPILLNGENLLGTAQTGTGKTAAFALPLLSRLDDKQHSPQILVLTPTRELAIQVAEAFQSYARHIKGFPRSANIRRCRYKRPTARPKARHPCRCRYTRTGSRSPAPTQFGSQPRHRVGARRSRRNAAHGLYRRCRNNSLEDPRKLSACAVFCNHAVGDQACCTDLPREMRNGSASRQKPRPSSALTKST